MRVGIGRGGRRRGKCEWRMGRGRRKEGKKRSHTFLFRPHDRRLCFLGACEFSPGLLAPTLSSAQDSLRQHMYLAERQRIARTVCDVIVPSLGDGWRND